MSETIAGILIVAVLLFGVMMVWKTTLTGNDLMSNAMRESFNLLQAKSQTEVTMGSVSFDPLLCELSMEATNTGSVSIVGSSFMDLIIKLRGANHFNRKFEFMASDSALLSDSWQMETEANQFAIEPDILNPGETATILVGLELPDPGITFGNITLAGSNGFTTQRSTGPINGSCARS